MVVILIRHGKTAGNEEHRYIGRTDLPLSEKGRAELKELWPHGIAADAVFASPMRRCLETAAYLTEAGICPESSGNSKPVNDLPKDSGRPENMDNCLSSDHRMDAHVIDGWREIDFGLWEGRTWQELSGDPGYQAWIDSGGKLAFPGGESREEFVRRTMAGWDIFMEECRKRDVRTALCVVHGGTVMAIMSSIAGGNYYDYRVGCGHGFVWDNGDVYLCPII